jgi:SAM-dependent methyltransferase
MIGSVDHLVTATESIPASLRRRLDAYGRRPENGVTPAMLAIWERSAQEARQALQLAEGRPKEVFEEPKIQPERRRLAHKYLSGSGIEIGALHNPLPVAEGVHVRYVDLCDLDVLRLLYPEIASFVFAPVDVVDDGERLSRFESGSLDFVVSNHFLEHCQDPLGALRAHLRVLREGGTLYCAVPDCRRTFDSGRPRTPFAHLWRDHTEGPAASRQEHYREWSRSVRGLTGLEHEAYWRLLDALEYSIHFHVWTPADVLEIVAELRHRLALPMDIQEFLVHGNECVLVVQKQ